MAETNFENATLKLLIEDTDGIVTVASLQQTDSSGGVVGPASATDGHLAVFDGATGQLLKDGGAAGSGGSFLSHEIARVDPLGSNSTGTIGDLAKPFLTVQGAIDAIEDGSFAFPIIDIGNNHFTETVTTSLPRIRFMGAADNLGSGTDYYAQVCQHLISTITSDGFTAEFWGCEIGSLAAATTHLLTVLLQNAGIFGSGGGITTVGPMMVTGNGPISAAITDVVTSSGAGQIELVNVLVDTIDSAGSNVVAESGTMIREIDAANNVSLIDSRVFFFNGASGTTTYSDQLLNGIATTAAPAAANSNGTKGQVAWDSGFIYVCTTNNTWKRAAIATWP